MERWLEFRTAFEVARQGTVSASAEALGVHRATISRHIDTLEAELGAKLFQRHGRGYVLTEIGEDFLRIAERTEQAFADFVGRTKLGTAEVSGEIILSVHSSLSGLVMQPISIFRAEHPGIRVVLIAQDSSIRLELGEAHVDLRTCQKPSHPDYVVQQLDDLRFGLYAHSDYVKKRGLPASEEEFIDHDFISHPAPVDQIPFERWYAENVPKERVVIVSSHQRVTNEAVLLGSGIGFLPERYARANPNLHAVVPLRPDWRAPAWLVTHVDLHRTVKVQAMLRAIKQWYAGDAAISGQQAEQPANGK
ncbi:MAG: LysR family transcriptional regulator [Pseudomonadota bacterium]